MTVPTERYGILILRSGLKISAVFLTGVDYAVLAAGGPQAHGAAGEDEAGCNEVHEG
jgi:hypothetical protein